MADYYWPKRDAARIIGKDTNRVDGLAKATGAAKYTYDIHPKNMLIARALGCPHAHCRIKAVDTAAAAKSPGVVHVHVLDHAKPGSEIEYEGELLVIVTAESEGAAAEGLSKVKIEYEPLDVFAREEDLESAEKAKRTARAGGKVVTQKEPGDDDDEDEFVEKEIERLLKASKHVVEGYYGIDAVTHCCLETHGTTVEWTDGKLLAHLSTQNVSGCDDQFARDLNITADDVTIHCDYVGGGFGSKFAPDYWSTTAAKISREVGRPVKLMLTRDQDQKIGGNRPSGYIKVRLARTRMASSRSGTRSIGEPPGRREVASATAKYRTSSYRRITVAQRRASAPTSPRPVPGELPIIRRAALSQTALDDLARKMGADSLEVFREYQGRQRRNVPPASGNLSGRVGSRRQIDGLAGQMASAWQGSSSWGNR